MAQRKHGRKTGSSTKHGGSSRRGSKPATMRSDSMKALNTTLTSPDEDQRRNAEQDRPRGRGRQTVRIGAAMTTAPDVQPRPSSSRKLPDLRSQSRRPERRATITRRGERGNK